MFRAASSPYGFSQQRVPLRPLPSKPKVPNTTKNFDEFKQRMFDIVANRDARIKLLQGKIQQVESFKNQVETCLETTNRILREKETTEEEIVKMLPVLQAKFKEVEAETEKLRQDRFKLQSKKVALEQHNRELEQRNRELEQRNRALLKRITKLESSASRATTP